MAIPILNTSGERFPKHQINIKLDMVRELMKYYQDKSLDIIEVSVLISKGASILACLIAEIPLEDLVKIGYKRMHAYFEMEERDFEERLKIGLSYAKKNNIKLPFQNREDYKEYIEQLPENTDKT